MTVSERQPIIDLHSHSTASDGVFAPARLIEEAASRGITTLALTDHDSISGLDEAEAAAREHGIDLLPGVEFTVGCAGSEVHLLGLGVDRTNRKLLGLCAEIQERRRRRFYEMMDRLRMAGVPLKTEGVAQGVSLARPYLARMLVEQGIVETYQEAFTRYLKKGAPGYVGNRRTPIKRAIDAIHAAGGVAVVAHPGLYRNGDEVVREAAEQGADGIECYHSDHNHDKIGHYVAMARKLGLLVSGGADFHGPDHARAKLFGQRSCPPEEFERMKNALAARATSN
jgi:predicted metal-dependent phosphoesterase TrpH